MKNWKFLSVAFFFLATSLLRGQSSYDEQYIKLAVESHLKRYGVLPKLETELKQKSEAEIRAARLEEYNKKIEKLEVDPREYRELSFTITPAVPLSFSAVIDSEFLRKMEIVASEDAITQEAPYLAKALAAHTVTHVGLKKTIEMICQPDPTATLAKKRQAVIQAIHREKLVYAKARAIFSPTLRAAEEAFFRLYIKHPLFDDPFKEIAPNPHNPGWFSRRNHSPLYQGIVGRTWQMGCFSTALLSSAGFLGSIAAALGPRSFLTSLFAEPTELATRVLALNFSLGLGGTALVNLGIAYAISNYQVFAHRTMVHIATYVRSAQALYSMLSREPIIRKNLPCLSELAELVHPSGKKSASFYKLVAQLSAKTFDRFDDNNEFKLIKSMKSNMGNIFAANYLMTECKDEFIPLVNAIGEIDAYLSIVTHLKQSKNSHAPWCFAEFLQRPHPVIEATDFWNPFIPQKQAVANSIQLGGGEPHGIMLTGPNTGGKSTTIKALMLNTLMAQTFGIAAARSFAFTPFRTLSSYLNITDNTGAGISLFKAEVLRAKQLVDMVRNLRSDEFAFLIMDEIFSGTNPTDAEQTSWEFVEGMCRYPNVLFINATHFPKLTLLEKDGLAANYHMQAITNNNGKVIKYTFKLEKGVSTVTSANQVATENGALWG